MARRQKLDEPGALPADSARGTATPVTILVTFQSWHEPCS